MMLKNIKLTDILLIILLGFMFYNSFFVETEKPEPITVTVPEYSGSTGTQYVEPKVVVVQVPVGDNKSIDVDSYWKEKYEQATQKVKDSLYNQAIKINKYKDTLVKDDRITITGEATTRGSLLDFKVDYTLEEYDFTYTPKTISERPTLSLDIQQGLLLPSLINTKLILPTQVGLTNKKGWKAGYQYDWVTQKHGGYIGKSFTIIK